MSTELQNFSVRLKVRTRLVCDFKDGVGKDTDTPERPHFAFKPGLALAAERRQ